MPADVVTAGGAPISGADALVSLGTFWSEHFGEKAQLRTLLDGSALQHSQNFLNYLEAQACTSRRACPVFHRYRWFKLTLKLSELDSTSAAMLRYNGEAVYDGTFLYGVPFTQKFHVADPGKLVRVIGLFDHVRNQQVCWTVGADFILDHEGLKLRYNPFNNPAFTITNVLDSNGAAIDQEVTLWAYEAVEDRDYLYQHYGYALRKRLPSSLAAKGLINAFLDGVVGGLSAQGLEAVLSALCDVPTARTDGEVVEVILAQPDALVVVTDKFAYRYPVDSTPAVDVGDVVLAGQCLTATVRVFDLSNQAEARALLTSSFDNVEPYDDNSVYSLATQPQPTYPLLEQLFVPVTMLGGGLRGSIGFPNALLPVDVSRYDEFGRIKARLTGLRASEHDQNIFWERIHAAGVASGTPWWQKAGNPAQLNAAGFMIEQFLCHNVLVVYLQTGRFGANAAGLAALDLLRRIMPPDKCLLFVVDDEGADVTTVDEAATPASFLGLETSEVITAEEGLTWTPISFPADPCP